MSFKSLKRFFPSMMRWEGFQAGADSACNVLLLPLGNLKIEVRFFFWNEGLGFPKLGVPYWGSSE